MATIEVAREDFGDPTDTKPVICIWVNEEFRNPDLWCHKPALCL